MRSLRSLSADRTAAKPILAAIVGILMITSTVGAYVVLFSEPSDMVGVGDRIKVDYVGKFADGRVFDTSKWDVASNDSAYPKSLFFTLRGNETKYAPLEFTVGQGTMIRGFDLGVQGMRAGETKVINITVADAYGPMDTTKMRTLQLEETLPMTAILDKAKFREIYGEEPASFRSVTDQRLGIPAYVLNYNSQLGRAEVSLQVQVNDTFHAYRFGPASGWDVKVTAIEDGVATIQHQISEADEFGIRGYDRTGLSWYNPQSRKTETLRDCYVDSVDEAAGTFVLNYNREVAGHELTFVVTVVSIA